MQFLIRLTNGRFIFGVFLMLFSFAVAASKWKYTALNEEFSTFTFNKFVTNREPEGGVDIQVSKVYSTQSRFDCPQGYQLNILPSPEDQYNVHLSLVIDRLPFNANLQMVTGTDILRGQATINREEPETVDRMDWIISSFPILVIGGGRIFLPIITRIITAARSLANGSGRYQIVEANFQVFNTNIVNTEELTLSVVIDTRNHSIIGVSGGGFGTLWIEDGDIECVVGTSRQSVLVEGQENPAGGSHIYLPPGREAEDCVLVSSD